MTFFSAKPNKAFLFNYLSGHLKKEKYPIGVDAGSASMKTRKMFNTDLYIGIDKNIDSLKRGLSLYNRPDTIAIKSDLTKLNDLSENSCDLIVSTYTLPNLSRENKNITTRSLCRLTAPNGIFYCQLKKDKDFPEVLKIIKSDFNNVKIIYYRNIISRIYEAIFKKHQHINLFTIAKTKVFLVLSLLISYLEYLTMKLPCLNDFVLIIACGKKINEKKNKFSFSNLELLDDRLYGFK